MPPCSSYLVISRNDLDFEISGRTYLVLQHNHIHTLTDGWVINRKTKKIVLFEFKRTSDCGESYYEDMWKVADKQHVPILTGLRALTGERGWEVEVVPLVAGQRSVREKE